MKKYLLFIGLFFHLAISQTDSSMTAQIVVNADTGWPVKVILNGYVQQDNAWLGISFYPYNTQNPETDGTHQIIQITDHSISKEIDVDQIFLDGSFEIALWEKRVDKVDCTLDYCFWCKANGFHLDGLLVYKSGLLTQLNGYAK
ncbi:MAG: hypothetical protein HQ510_09965 [Candidatus Marinimicrobia bacterium]|nr:hypothetical protein [Candidatus Neomarinimicrobiota bacterium]